MINKVFSRVIHMKRRFLEVTKQIGSRPKSTAHHNEPENETGFPAKFWRNAPKSAATSKAGTDYVRLGQEYNGTASSTASNKFFDRLSLDFLSFVFLVSCRRVQLTAELTSTRSSPVRRSVGCESSWYADDGSGIRSSLCCM